LKTNISSILNLDILPSNYELKSIIEDDNKNAYKKIAFLISSIIKEKIYDFIVIDTHPDFNDLIVYLIQLSNVLVIPFEPATEGELAVKDFLKSYNDLLELNSKLKTIVVPNRYSFVQKKISVKDENGKPKKDNSGNFVKELRFVEDLGFSIIEGIKSTISLSKMNVKVSACISESKMYRNSVALYSRPLCGFAGKTSKAEKKAIKEQEELNSLILTI